MPFFDDLTEDSGVTDTAREDCDQAAQSALR